jgi:prophage antirepressor-like protein
MADAPVPSCDRKKKGRPSGSDGLHTEKSQLMSSSESTALQSLTFEDHHVRIVLDEQGEPWWVAKDVAEALGYPEETVASSMSKLVDKVPAEWRSKKPFLADGGTREMLFLSEQGLYFFMSRSNMPAALPFQKWIAGEVIPQIRKTGQYAVKQLTAAELMAAMAQELVNQERRTLALENRVTAIEARRIEAERELLLLPAPTVAADPLTDRAMINRLVRQNAEATQLEHSAVWNQLYREFTDRYHIDLKARARLAGDKSKPLDIAESLGCLPQLYSTAWTLYSKSAS